jgi:hypothetical protein
LGSAQEPLLIGDAKGEQPGSVESEMVTIARLSSGGFFHWILAILVASTLILLSSVFIFYIIRPRLAD